jgi:hypothetical protein
MTPICHGASEVSPDAFDHVQPHDGHVGGTASPPSRRGQMMERSGMTQIGSAVIVAVALAACAGDDGDPSSDVAAAATTPPAVISATPATTTEVTASPAISDQEATTTTAASATTVAPDWRDQATAICDHFINAGMAIPEPDGTAQSVTTFVGAHRQIFDTSPTFSADVPLDTARLAELITQAGKHLAAAETAAAGGDIDGALDAIDAYNFTNVERGALYLLGGATCGVEPSRAESAALNVPLGNGPGQLELGFGSVWVNQSLTNSVVRIDPGTGDVLATVDVGSVPFKMQPADGRMWVRTADTFVAIDPVSNTVTATLSKADVGPAANRSWAVDGALWICDGSRLHRYDPTTLQPVTVIELGLDCGQVYATSDLVVAWTYNEDDGQSGSSAAAFIDPATNETLATVSLPVDVEVPVVLDSAVFLPGNRSSTAVVVDRSSWTVTARPDMGRPTRCSQCAFDGASIYLPTDDDGTFDVLVVDATTYEVTGTLETLGANSLDVGDGALWVVDDTFMVLQRFDIPS